MWTSSSSRGAAARWKTSGRSMKNVSLEPSCGRPNRSFQRSATKWISQFAICEQQLVIAVQQRLRKWHQAFGRIAHTLDALSPLAVLERGYAICLAPDGRVVRSADAVDVDQTVKVKLHQGSLSARVTAKE